MPLKINCEVKIDADPCLLAWSERLYVGCENGTIMTFDASLKPGSSWSAHGVQLFALEVGGGRVYSASNDGGVRIWSTSGEKLNALPDVGADIGSLRLDGDQLYAGDELGGVSMYEKDTLKAKYNVLEEVKDILVKKPFLMTVRDLDVTVTEIKPDSSKTQFMTRHTMEGRAPICRAGSKLLLVSRDGRSIRLHDDSIDAKYKLLSEQTASDMILTSLAVSNGGDTVWSAGWDGRVRRWTVGDTAIAPAGELDLGGACVNALVASQEPDVVYAAVAGGKIVKVNA